MFRTFTLIAGPCVIENEDSATRICAALRAICGSIGIPLIFKSSFDKANRTSLHSYRGPGMIEGLRILKRRPFPRAPALGLEPEVLFSESPHLAVQQGRVEIISPCRSEIILLCVTRIAGFGAFSLFSLANIFEVSVDSFVRWWLDLALHFLAYQTQ